MRAWSACLSRAGALTLILVVLALGRPVARGQEVLPPVPNPETRDAFELDLAGTRALSQALNFEVVGHSYLRGPWLVPAARGVGINTPRVHNGIAYLGG